MNGLVVALLTYNLPSKALSTALSISKVISNIPHAEFLIIENNSRCNMNISLVARKVSYFLKKVNKGLDNSIIQALAFAKLKGKIIWFLCDDDHLYIDNLPKILRQLSNMNSSLVYVPWEGPTGKLPYANNIISIYERMSFLPTIACNPRDISLLKLRRLVGTNYVHIALLNLLLKKIIVSIQYLLLLESRLAIYLPGFLSLKHLSMATIKPFRLNHIYLQDTCQSLFFQEHIHHCPISKVKTLILSYSKNIFPI